MRRVAIVMQMPGPEYAHRVLCNVDAAPEIGRFDALGRVPAPDDGTVRVDSAAILDHVADTAGPSRALIPGSEYFKRDVLQTDTLMTGALERQAAAHCEKMCRRADKVHQRPGSAGVRRRARAVSRRWRR